MFQIVALAYIVFGLNTVDPPLRFDHRLSFMTLDECQSYLKSEKFAADKIVIRRDLVAALDKKENEEVPGIAITASCEDDHRL